ncbi:IclR family transcriptional regulator [Sutcliffiella horikoshii]|uniref:IclR family transcriptional regulator n=1 Tax=Sutcliffiella horikoshii TaxID=79883 RepID=UPI001CFD04B3|nr:IclR family transcriptional regulator [Sutcliffiella horikoshii]
MTPSLDKSKTGVRAVDRALDIIETFSLRERELTLVDISKKTGLPLTTVHRNVQSLLQRGYLEQDEISGKFRPGMQFVRVAGILIQGLDLVQKASPYLHRLAKKTEMNVNLSIYDDGEALCLVNIESFHNFGFEIKVGQKLPIYAGALSKLILAYLPEREFDRLSDTFKTFTPITISQRQELKNDIESIRQHGYAKSEGELQLGAVAYAAPVFNYEGKLEAGIAITGPEHFFSEEKRQTYLKTLLLAAEEISRDLGYKKVY